MSINEDDPRSAARRYPWIIVGFLWFCGFFNYADRQAVTSVFPLLVDEFGLSKTQLGMIGSAFMVVYALSAPLAGFIVDRTSRRVLIVGGLAFWSAVCAATALSRSYHQLLFFRAAEGLGESFYFPASMSLLADYHGLRTRSRAMSLHQTSVYVGTAMGGLLAGMLGERFGWRSPFWILGLIGMIYSGWLWARVVEPARGKSTAGEKVPTLRDDELFAMPIARPRFSAAVLEIVRTPSAALLLATFSGANFVASAFLTWLTMFVYTKFAMSLSGSSFTSMLYPLASLVGALGGGALADRASRRAGGRMRVQAMGLIAGAPFVLAAGSVSTVPLLAVALVGVGLCKGIYDANIFASIYDVVRPEVRGTAAGIMNTVGWTGGSLAPMAIGLAADRFGLSLALASTASIYLLVGFLCLAAARFASLQASRA